MKKKEQILRIRPFNMANFSGAGGYIPVFAILGAFVSFPATLLLWTGLAVSIKSEDGSVNDAVLKKRLKRILLPIYLVSLGFWFLIVTGQISDYGGNLFGAMIATVLVAGLHIGGMYLSIFYSAKLLGEKSCFTKEKWFLLTLAFSAIMVAVGIVVPLLLFAIAL